ncbi:DUF5011 domain-containing protein [Deminuibacter soli]|uniref:DUF5011 domain-containing protein n=1 Tax=Deminuibacter soli TaxID=2291815 RepID=A0A3E1NDE6_9BACT|nr:DUF5011 domain-containing protein [Deminuibacter soli]RFM25986.1 DUF5011 domain-containing protein [Deminuibacter soli]
MKQYTIQYLLFTITTALLLFGCNKENDVTQNDRTVGHSTITYYATVTLKGDPYMSIVKGGTFTDPGASAEAQGKDIPVTVSGSVDASTPGLYTLTYSAVNADGFAATATRTVAVLPVAETPGTDISGSYYYIASPSTLSSVVKLAEGFYSTSNCWSAATTIPCLFICTDGTNITMPVQPTGFGALNGTGTLDASGALTYVVTIPSQNINGTLRKWHKQ